jgi:hypothetical protein
VGRQLQELPGRGYVLEVAVVSDGSVSPDRAPAAALSRRALLTASAAALPLLITACKGVQALGTPPPPPADVRRLQAAISAEAAMVGRYASALQRLRAGFAPHASPADTAAYAAARSVQAEHVAHLAQLRSRLVEPPGARPSPLNTSPVHPSPSGSPLAGATGAGATGAGATGTVHAVLGELVLAEQAASDWLIGELGGLPPSLAQLFASIAASEATHVEYLRAARRAR